MCIFFFFSSRRRHTSWSGDWSSDVCSSDLGGGCESNSQADCYITCAFSSNTMCHIYWQPLFFLQLMDIPVIAREFQTERRPFNTVHRFLKMFKFSHAEQGSSRLTKEKAMSRKFNEYCRDVFRKFVHHQLNVFILGYVNEYPTMHYFGIPRHTQSMIAFEILTEYFWKFQWLIAF